MKTSRVSKRRKAPKNKTVEIMADWKDVDGLLRQLRRALRVFGVEMKSIPETRGTDVYGFILRPSGSGARRRAS